jgi:hypothetical protein
LYHSKLWCTGKIKPESAQRPETIHKLLNFANLGQIELGGGWTHPGVSDAGINGAT